MWLRNGSHVIPFLIAVAVDDHLAIRFPVALLDDRCFAWLALALFDYGRSVAISVAMILTYRHCGSDRARRPQLPAPPWGRHFLRTHVRSHASLTGWPERLPQFQFLINWVTLPLNAWPCTVPLFPAPQPRRDRAQEIFTWAAPPRHEANPEHRTSWDQ